MDANKLRVGYKILIDDQPYIVVSALQRKQARSGSKMISKIKNLITGATMERTFNGTDNINEADITNSSATFLYNDGDAYHFMEDDTFEQFEFNKEQLADDTDFLVEDIIVQIMKFNGNPINVELPPTVTLKVIETPPGVKGDTASGAGTKPATLDSGLVINVPLFINIDDEIVINTSTREYKERSKK